MHRDGCTAQLRQGAEVSRLPDTVLEKRRGTSQASLSDHCVACVHQKDAPKFRSSGFHSLGTEVLYKYNICSVSIFIDLLSWFLCQSCDKIT